ncbi:peroxidase family protein [Actinosynnema sp. NPDC047251]|nr:peroxidase family protein [Saccharothrix espanaensis]
MRTTLRRKSPLVVMAVVVAQLVAGGAAIAHGDDRLRGFEVQSLDGSGNNVAHPEWGRAGGVYPRVAPARYADGIGAPVAGPNARRISNRVFDDRDQNLFSPRRVSQWSTAWGQFVDHTFGLRASSPEGAPIPFDNADPAERFTNDFGIVPFSRSRAATGTGVTTTREQPNTIGSYIDAYAVYGGTPQRLEWLREGPVDGDLTNNGARLLLPGDLLPRQDARGDAASAPPMDSALGASPRLAVAGDIRANENISLLAVQTLFAREHNRIVSLLPAWLGEEQRFQLARRVVIATQQHITYQGFLPGLGVRLAPYRGYDPTVDAGLGNEFATVGYRAHSMIGDEITVTGDAARYSADVLDALRAAGVRVAPVDQGRRVELTVPSSIVLFNPDLAERLQLGPLLQALSARPQARNDEQIGDVVRSVELSSPDCVPVCGTIVFDIAAIDVERGRDHGMPSYNDLRRGYGLPAKQTFRAITGEATESFPADPELTPGAEVDDPDSLDFLHLYDRRGAELQPGSEAARTSAVRGVRRTTTAARLKAVYGEVSTVDAFVGMMAEPPLPGAEFGELQAAIWKRQFEALRDGDRFFHLHDPVLPVLRQRFGIDHRRSLGDVIALNTDVPRGQLPADVFFTS